MPFVVTPEDRLLFGRCLRAWDFGAAARSGLRPWAADDPLEYAFRGALRVYYFPGMWDWKRPIVHSLASRKLLELASDLAPSERDAIAARLASYFAWAPGEDAFTPMRVESAFAIGIADPDCAPAELAAADGEPVRYHDRIDALVVDSAGEHWMLEHRFRRGAWCAPSDLADDEHARVVAAAWESYFLGMTVAGTLYNEIDLRVSPGGPCFRRTAIRWPRDGLAAALRRLGVDARDMLEAARRSPSTHPSLDRAVCSHCAYRRPCIALEEHRDPAAALAEGFRKHAPGHVPESGLAGRGLRAPRAADAQ